MRATLAAARASDLSAARGRGLTGALAHQLLKARLELLHQVGPRTTEVELLDRIGREKALDAWAYRNRVELHFIQPGKPIQNAYVESFNGKSRDECLSEYWFLSLDEARELIEDWRQEYNQFPAMAGQSASGQHASPEIPASHARGG